MEFTPTGPKFPSGPGSFKHAKETGALAAALGRAPMLRLADGTELGQSKTIERYLARELGLMGVTASDAARIDMICEHVRDIKDK